MWNIIKFHNSFVWNIIKSENWRYNNCHFAAIYWLILRPNLFNKFKIESFVSHNKSFIHSEHKNILCIEYTNLKILVNINNDMIWCMTLRHRFNKSLFQLNDFWLLVIQSFCDLWITIFDDIKIAYACIDRL